MSICVPVRDMKNTAEFAALVEHEREVTVTKNGYTAMHCLSDQEYRLQQEEVAKARLFSRILLAENEIAEGPYSDFSEFESGIRDEYAL